MTAADSLSGCRGRAAAFQAELNDRRRGHVSYRVVIVTEPGLQFRDGAIVAALS
jgi:hypothetical protein